MAASDHLSGAQFYPIEQIGGLKSQVMDEHGRELTVEESYYHSPTRWDDFEDQMAQAKGHPNAKAYHAALVNHMREHGMVTPVTFQEGYLANGHHRYFAARDLGLTHIPAEPFKGKKAMPVPGWDR